MWFTYKHLYKSCTDFLTALSPGPTQVVILDIHVFGVVDPLLHIVFFPNSVTSSTMWPVACSWLLALFLSPHLLVFFLLCPWSTYFFVLILYSVSFSYYTILKSTWCGINVRTPFEQNVLHASLEVPYTPQTHYIQSHIQYLHQVFITSFFGAIVKLLRTLIPL